MARRPSGIGARAFVALVLLAACSAPDREAGVTERTDLAGLNLAAPAADAAQDLAAGHPKCYSVDGYARSFPGVVGDRDSAWCQERGINFACTSDYLDRAELRRLDGPARRYAEAYNRFVLAHRR